MYPRLSLPVPPGTRHALTCNVTRNPAFPNTTELDVTWLDPNNTAINDSVNVYFSIIGGPVVGSNKLSSVLEFNHMLTSQAGPYICVVTMTVPGLVTDYSTSRTLNVTVRCEYNNCVVTGYMHLAYTV